MYYVHGVLKGVPGSTPPNESVPIIKSTMHKNAPKIKKKPSKSLYGYTSEFVLKALGLTVEF